MTKDELISKMAQDAKLTKKSAKAALDSFTSTISKTLKKGGRLSLVGWGTFSVSKRKARTGRNPRTGEALQIKARNVVRFKPGTKLAKSVNK
jgi:DNA-binding protein HU-beta